LAFASGLGRTEPVRETIARYAGRPFGSVTRPETVDSILEVARINKAVSIRIAPET
jgi:hypothetical protein